MELNRSLEKIQAFYEKHGRMPSIREVGNHILKTRSIRQTKEVVDALVTESLIIRDARGKLQPTISMLGIRALGTVEAGFPSPAEEELADTVTLDEWLIGDRSSTYMLSIKGESMINAGIRPGDKALVERGREPKHGDIVIAQVDGKWTMKYYHIEARGKIALVPANPKFPTLYPKEELKIEAIVTAIIRKY